MYYHEDTTSKNNAETSAPYPLLIDGTVSLDDSDDDLQSSVGLVAWIKTHLGIGAN